MDPEKIGKFIYSLRKEKNLSQYQLADMIPISRQAVSKWERGKTTPDSLTLLKLSEIFNVTINELLTGERLLDDSIKGLEETTLSILDQSNKKSKRIKRNLITFIIIILTFLLAFLSYYFINSYNTTHVYTISGDNTKFNTNNGIFITTKEKYYLKLGKLRHDENIIINNLELYYKNNGKKIVIAEDIDIDNLTVADYYGYSEKITKKDLKYIRENTYLKITYNDTEEEILKLRFRKDFTNTEIFTKKKKTLEIEPAEDKEEVKDDKTEENQETNQEENITPTINETKVNDKTPEPVKEEPKVEPQKEEITLEKILQKIKEKGEDIGDGYMYTFNDNDDSIIIIYYKNIKQISIYKNDEFIGDYYINENRHSCFIKNCTSTIDNVLEIFATK